MESGLCLTLNPNFKKISPGGLSISPPAIPAGWPSELASALQYPNTLRKLEITSVGRYFHFL